MIYILCFQWRWLFHDKLSVDFIIFYGRFSQVSPGRSAPTCPFRCYHLTGFYQRYCSHYSRAYYSKITEREMNFPVVGRPQAPPSLVNIICISTPMLPTFCIVYLRYSHTYHSLQNHYNLISSAFSTSTRTSSTTFVKGFLLFPPRWSWFREFYWALLLAWSRPFHSYIMCVILEKASFSSAFQQLNYFNLPLNL